MYPVLLRFGHLSLPTFGVLAIVGLMLALGLSERTSRLAGVSPEKLWNAGLLAILAAYVLSRGLLLVAHPHAFAKFPLLLLAVPSLTAAGVLLTAIATLAWLWRQQIPLRPALDAWAPCATLVWGFLALGHFAEGSDPGMPTGLAWGVPMPGSAQPLHPVALYASLFAFALTVPVYRRVARGDAAALALMGAGAGQFLLSFLRQPGVETVLGLDLLEWVALGMMAAGWLLWSGSPPARRGFAQANPHVSGSLPGHGTPDA